MWRTTNGRHTIRVRGNSGRAYIHRAYRVDHKLAMEAIHVKELNNPEVRQAGWFTVQYDGDILQVELKKEYVDVIREHIRTKNAQTDKQNSNAG